MPHIPLDAKWYLADLVMQFAIEGDDTPLVHVNTILIRAEGPDEAYQKALALGMEDEDVYENPDHKRVQARFRGLRNLFEIYEDLVDGAELIYEEKVGLAEAQILELVKEKHDLAVFRDD